MYLVTVVIPFFNAHSTIGRTLKSIFSQAGLTEGSIEVIVVDDCSTIPLGRNISIINSALRIITLPVNKGAAYARNKGIEEAKGRFVAFCDSDDYWQPNKLSIQLDFMMKNDSYFTYTSYYKYFATIDRKVLVEAPVRQSYDDLIRSCSIGCSTVVIDREKLNEELKMPNIRRRQDYATWLYLTKKYGPALGLKEPFTFYTISKGSISRNKLVAARQHYQVLASFETNTLKRLFYFSFYLIKGLNKYLKY